MPDYKYRLNPIAIIHVGLAVMPAQIVFLAQHLTMEQPCGRGDVIRVIQFGRTKNSPIRIIANAT